MNLADKDIYERHGALLLAAEDKLNGHYQNAVDVKVRVVKGEVCVSIEGHKVFTVTTSNPIHVELGTL